MTTERLNPKFGAPPLHPYCLAFRLKAKDFAHPYLYVAVTTDVVLAADCCTFQVENFPGGSRSLISNRIGDRRWRHTEGPPGLEPGQPWVFALCADTEFKITGLTVEDRSAFAEMVEGR